MLTEEWQNRRDEYSSTRHAFPNAKLERSQVDCRNPKHVGVSGALCVDEEQLN